MTKKLINLEQEWSEKIKQLLVGRRIVDVSYMTDTEAEGSGWDFKPIQIKLDDGTLLTPTQDDEGNDGGSLFTNIKKLPIIPTMCGKAND